MKHRLLLPLLPAMATLALAAAPATAAASEAVSENWAGYEATSTSSSGFSAVSGGWVQPTAKCTDGQSDYGAFWVGLGGAGSGSDALEQVGTQSDCTAGGQAIYYAWYELVPKAPVKLDLAISPGDRIYARTAVSGDSVTVTLSDQTRGQSATRTLTMSDPSPDTSTAEWIAEAPSQCAGGDSSQCEPLPLTDFGSVKFDSAYATSDGHTGAISAWNPQAIALQSSAGGYMGSGYGGYGYASDTGITAAGAQPSSLSSGGSSFTVAYESDAADTATAPADPSGYGQPGGYGYGYAGSNGYTGGGYGYGGYGGYTQSYGYGSGPGAYIYAY